MSLTRREQFEIAQRLRTDGGGGEGLTLAAIAREMGVSVSYVGALLTDPTGEKERARKRKYLKRCKEPGCGKLCHGKYCKDHGSKAHGLKRRKWSEEMIIEAIQEWEIIHGIPPTSNEWATRGNLPEWVPTTGVVYRVFGKHGWNKAMEAAGFTPRPAQFPEWHVQLEAGRQHRTMGPEVRERMSEERKALYAENPDHPMFSGLKEGWDLRFHQRERRGRQLDARQVPRK